MEAWEIPVTWFSGSSIANCWQWGSGTSYRMSWASGHTTIGGAVGGDDEGAAV